MKKTAMTLELVQRAKAMLREKEIEPVNGTRILLPQEQADEALKLGWIEGYDFLRIQN